MEDYFAAKRLLFEAHPEVAVINVDDAYGARLVGELEGVARVVTFAIDAQRGRPAGDRSCAATSPGRRSDAGGLELRSPLPGRFNVLNVLGAVATARALGVDDETIVAALPVAGRVPGRFEPVDEGQGFAVLVDYAHTPDSLENVLAAARPLTRGSLVCVFGCGGDRDRGKRPQMGEISARLADHTIVTSDNPRSEDPERDRRRDHGRDRRSLRVPRRSSTAARRSSVRSSSRSAGDVVVVAGKGHEQGQELEGGRKLPFDDVTVAREALRARLVA